MLNSLHRISLQALNRRARASVSPICGWADGHVFSDHLPRYVLETGNISPTKDAAVIKRQSRLLFRAPLYMSRGMTFKTDTAPTAAISIEPSTTCATTS